MERMWIKGDTHLHTINSDGTLTKGQLVEACKKKGLDFMIITDHNYNSVEKSYYDGNILVIQGQELTDEPGHVNIWGKKVPHDPPHKLDTAEDYKKIIDECKKAGATVSVNHPFCGNCPFRLDLEDYPFDCVEVWNTIQHSDNMKNRDWWVNQLLKGNRIAAVGGSDYHKDYFNISLLAKPTTYVNVPDNTEKDILQALREGRSVITNGPDTTMIYMEYGDARVGDTAKLDDNLELVVKMTKLKKGHRVLVYNNDKIIYDQTMKKNIFFNTIRVKLKEKGFVRVEVTRKVNPAAKQIYSAIESKYLHGNGYVPDFIWAFTNPIWIE